MPLPSAGIVGLSSDIKTSGIEVDPKLLVFFALGFVLLVKIADVFVK